MGPTIVTNITTDCVSDNAMGSRLCIELLIDVSGEESRPHIAMGASTLCRLLTRARVHNSGV